MGKFDKFLMIGAFVCVIGMMVSLVLIMLSSCSAKPVPHEYVNGQRCEGGWQESNYDQWYCEKTGIWQGP